MHDTPGKVWEIWSHQERAEEMARPDGFEDYERSSKDADHFASAADRLPWPKPSALKESFDGVDNYFRHAMAGDQAPYKFDVTFQSAAEAETGGQVARPTLLEDDPRA